jgi:hypothetical protein
MKIARAIRSFIERKRKATEHLLNAYKHHCAIYIQKVYKGYIHRKAFKELHLMRMKLKALILGWKTRRVMKHPEILVLKSPIKNSPVTSLINDFFIKFEQLFSGAWASKSIQVPIHRRLLYKKNTLKLKIVHERRHSAAFTEESQHKDAEERRSVKFCMSNQESPKYYEPNISAQAPKSILKQKGMPTAVDWDSLQKQLDKLFYESEARVSIEDNNGLHQFTDGSEKLLFKLPPRIKKKIRREAMKNWKLGEFEESCKEDAVNSRKFFPIAISTKVPHLRSGAKFFEQTDTAAIYSRLKKEYNGLRNGFLGIVGDAN